MAKRQSLEVKIARLIKEYTLADVSRCVLMAVELTHPTKVTQPKPAAKVVKTPVHTESAA